MCVRIFCWFNLVASLTLTVFQFIGYGNKASLRDTGDSKPLTPSVNVSSCNLVANGNHENHVNNVEVLVNSSLNQQQQPSQQIQQQQHNLNLGITNQLGISKMVSVAINPPASTETLHINKRLKAN